MSKNRDSVVGPANSTVEITTPRKKKKKSLMTRWRHFYATRVRCSMWLEIIRNIFHKEPELKNEFTDKAPYDHSIYPTKNQTVGSYHRKFYYVHYFIKYKLFVPFLLIFRSVLKKYGDWDVEDQWYNKNLIVFDKSYKETMQLMAKYYNYSFADPRKGSFKSYDTARVLALTLALNDSVTREFFNVLMHTIAKNMHEAYKGCDQVYHVMYSGMNAYNPVYFKLAKVIMKENVHPKEILRNEIDAKDVKVMRDNYEPNSPVSVEQVEKEVEESMRSR